MGMECVNHDDKNLTNKTNKGTAPPCVNVHVLCVEGALGLGGHVVIGVARFHHAYAIPSVEFFPS